ncbi:ubiquinol-cytochrome c reductase iron-sulfur subunit [Mariniphaga sp.]|uniref:QcrA and Rieske domain-containing protein n=1 Tax=Mariniphaga sp. TaxID=1954475 RepID=UPI003565DB57
MERKDFIQKFAIGGSILLTTPLLFNACSDGNDDVMDDEENGQNGNGIKVDLNNASFAALKDVGGFAYTGNIIVIRSGENAYIALSKICTHEGCTVTYNHANSQLPCPCHGSVFSSTGAVVNGPANSNLKTYSVKKEGDILTIT